MPFDNMPRASLELALYEAEAAGRFNEADDIALYLMSYDMIADGMLDADDTEWIFDPVQGGFHPWEIHQYMDAEAA